jgi:hypothetical protein
MIVCICTTFIILNQLLFTYVVIGLLLLHLYSLLYLLHYGLLLNLFVVYQLL